MKAIVTTKSGTQEIKFRNETDYLRWYYANRKSIINMTLTKA